MAKKVVRRVMLGVIFLFMPFVALSQNSSNPTFSADATVEYQNEKPTIKLDWTAQLPSSFGYIIEEGLDDKKEILAVIDTPETNEESTGGYYLDDDIEIGQTYDYTITPFDTLGNSYNPASVNITVNEEGICKNVNNAGIYYTDPTTSQTPMEPQADSSSSSS